MPQAWHAGDAREYLLTEDVPTTEASGRPLPMLAPSPLPPLVAAPLQSVCSTPPHCTALPRPQAP